MNLIGKEIEQEVIQVLRDFVRNPRREINLNDHLVRDLRVDSDEASFCLIPKLETMLGFSASNAEWREVGTVADLIALVARHKRCAGSSS